MEWEREFHDVAVLYEPKVVRVKTDGVLMAFLAEPEKGAQALARHILARYQQKMGCALAIGETSLAVEILCHAYCDDLLLRMAKLLSALPGELGQKLSERMTRVHRRTEIIDMGEREADSNRWLFDDLTPFYGVICKILGDKA